MLSPSSRFYLSAVPSPTAPADSLGTSRRPRGTHARCMLRPDSAARSWPVHLVLGLAHCLLDLCPHVLMARLPLTMGFRHRCPQHDELSRRMDRHRNGLFPCGRHSGFPLLAPPTVCPQGLLDRPQQPRQRKGLAQAVRPCLPHGGPLVDEERGDRAPPSGDERDGRQATCGRHPLAGHSACGPRAISAANKIRLPEANVVPWTATPLACEAGHAGVRQ
jgi:hypothetical protein